LLSGTAVNVQAMAYGNLDDSSGTGVLFTRNPNTGAHELFGEYLVLLQIHYLALITSRFLLITGACTVMLIFIDSPFLTALLRFSPSA